MSITLDTSLSRTPASAPVSRPQSREEAARQFEQILVRQFVEVMTKDLFGGGLSGDDGPGWMQGQQDMQRDMMTDMLTDHIAGSGALRISDLLLRQWTVKHGETPDAEGDAAL
jgi:flagellar protein FlgJ